MEIANSMSQMTGYRIVEKQPVSDSEVIVLVPSTVESLHGV